LVKKFSIPWELKYKYVKGMLTTVFKGFMYEIRTKFDAATALEIYEMVQKRDKRVENMVNALKDVFNIEGNGIEAISTFLQIWFELTGWEVTWFDQLKTFIRFKCPLGCAWMTKPEDLSEWFLVISNIFVKSINPKAIIVRHIGMCAGDSSCEYIIKLEE
jgi:hypothetical protein